MRHRNNSALAFHRQWWQWDAFYLADPGAKRARNMPCAQRRASTGASAQSASNGHRRAD